jgi:hypothetical protein
LVSTKRGSKDAPALWGTERQKGEMQDYLGWKYGWHKDGETIVFDVVPNEFKPKPDTFFKYYALSDYSVEALTNMYVYASHPAQLNDPFDCDMKLAKIEDENNAKALLQPIYEEVKQLFSDNRQSLFEFSTDCFSTLIFRKQGVLSLTDSCENMRMWALYTANTGFCVEWDINQFRFATKGPFPIHYVDAKDIRELSSKEFDVRTMALIQTNVKQDCWDDENEWRLLIQSPQGFDMKTFGKHAEELNQFSDHDRKFKYPIHALKSITLGINFFKDVYDKQQIISVSPYEIHVCYQKICHQTKVLDFLAAIGKSVFSTIVSIRMMIKIGLEHKIVPIAVVKIGDLTFRITESK